MKTAEVITRSTLYTSDVLARLPHLTKCTGCRRDVHGNKGHVKVCTVPFGVLCESCARNLIMPNGTTR